MLTNLVLKKFTNLIYINLFAAQIVTGNNLLIGRLRLWPHFKSRYSIRVEHSVEKVCPPMNTVPSINIIL